MIRVIVNPIAGVGRSLKLLPEVCAELDRRGLVYEVVHTECVGHATQLAREADGTLIVMGGDGTLSEVVSGLGEHGMMLYFVPCGTGNDFVKTLRLPKDPIAALRLQLDSPKARIDVPRLNGRNFLNVAGTGFDIEVLRQTERFKARYSGLIAYLLGVATAIRHFKPVKVRLTVDGQTQERLVTIIEVANGQYFGGGMRIAPGASPCDGKLDLVYVDAVKRWHICLLLPLFIPGWYVHLPIAHVQRVTAITIESDGMVMNIDGNLVAADRAEFGVMPGLISTHCPLPVPARAHMATPTSYEG